MNRKAILFRTIALFLAASLPVHGDVYKISGGTASGVTSGATAITGGGTTQVCFNNAGILTCGDSDLTFSTDTLTATKAVTGAGTVGSPALRVNDANTGLYSDADDNLLISVGGTLYRRFAVASGGVSTSNFERFTATMPSTMTATTNAARYVCTGAGSSSQVSSCAGAEYLAGYTGSSASLAVDGRNQNLGTGTTAAVAGGGNYSIFGLTNGVASGDNVGVWGGGWSGSGKNYGAIGYGNTTVNSATAVGVLGLANSSGTTPTTVGGWFQNGSATPTFTSTALGANNGSVAVPIFTAQDNGTTVATIEDGGSHWQMMGSKALSEGAATTFARVSVAAPGRQGGIVEYCVDANDASNYQSRCGSVSFAVSNTSGSSENCAFGTAADGIGTTSGTLTVSFAADVATPTNACDLQANATSSLTQTTLRINYTVRLFGNAVTAVTAQ